MLLGPVFTAEMVSTARRRRYFLLRLLFGGALLFMLWMCALAVQSGGNVGSELTLNQSAQLAQAFFVTFSWVTLCSVLIVVPALAAGSIATERDRRTIEYLFATDLSNAEIILSKLFAKLLLVGQLLLVSLPVLAIFRLLGGIPGDLLLAFFLILASTCLLLVMTSLTVSVWTTRARDAMTRVYLLLIAWLALPTFTWMWLSFLTPRGGLLLHLHGWVMSICDALNSINPLWVYGNAAGVGGGAMGMSLDQGIVWQMAAWHLAISAVLAVVAIVSVRRVHLTALGKSGDKKKTAWMKSMQYRPALGNHPMIWKECFARTAGTKLGWVGRIALMLIMIVTLGIGVSAFIGVLYYGNSGWRTMGEAYVGCSAATTCLYGTGIVLLVGVRAAGLISYEKERDCWLSLLATPLSGGEIVSAKSLGNIYAFRWLPLPMLVVWGLQTVLYPPYIIAVGFNLIVLIVTSLFASAVGVAFSLKFNTTLKAIGATVGVLIFVGGGYLLCCCMPIMFASSGGGDEFMIAFSMCIPFLLSVPSMAMFNNFNEEWFVADYIMGMIAYGVLTALIYSWAVGNFDETVGRTTMRTTHETGIGGLGLGQ